MHCEQARELLSAYYDRELLPEMREAVSDHLAGCTACMEDLRGFQILSEMTTQLVTPAAPAAIWSRLEQDLHVSRRDPSAKLSWVFKGRARQLSGLAGLAALVVVGIAIWLHSSSSPRGNDDHARIAQDFSQYLDRFSRNPEEAQRVLMASYRGQELDAERAQEVVGFTLAACENLPPNYSIEAICVFDTPCCKCPQVIYQRTGDSQQTDGVIAVFEHEREDPTWFGGRPAITALCCGKTTRIVEVDNLLVVTWASGNRYLTIVGARDIQEVTRLVSHLERKEPSS